MTEDCWRCRNFPLAEPREHRYTAKIAWEWPLCLDIQALVAMFRATFGKPGAAMRNIITKLLIAVVPRHTAGGG
ncbi:hypothetical protein AXW67_05685 [Bradyrhizobium neotropicale]|uniref:Uncharacterized protein n=1 Tax=Bradyrhizobium neotropicale TaxID=1497615 RepID=A0A176ZBH9_9BRAD|nr:hypothetical protein AXW67_05685 [Bradyrhizobium neotropicale]